VHALRDALAGAGIRSKRRTRPDIQNRLYRGEIFHNGNIYQGEHPSIVHKPLWDEVQAVLAGNRVARADGARGRHPSLLTARSSTRPANV
jgi:site-specific DNA recombinase